MRLSELRTARNLSQQRLAIEVGVDQTSISNYELGKYFPSIEVVAKLADYFCVSIDYFLGLTDNRTPPNIVADDQSLHILSLFSSLSRDHKIQALGYLERLKEEEMRD